MKRRWMDWTSPEAIAEEQAELEKARLAASPPVPAAPEPEPETPPNEMATNPEDLL